MNDPEVWRRRFEQYRPLELVRWVQNVVRKDDPTVAIALEELDRQLIAAGFEARY